MQGAVTTTPEKLVLSSLWENPQILRNDKIIPKSSFQYLQSKIRNIADLFVAGTNTLCSREVLENKFSLEIDEASFTELRYIVLSSFSKVGIDQDNLPTINLPYQPLLVNIANSTKTGCSRYYALLRNSKNLGNMLNSRESRWHSELGKAYSIPFWNKTYRYVADIKNDNRTKWMQFQIVRNCQYTNYRVNKFKPNVSPLCSYCKEDIELISHLYFKCPIVLNFWKEVKICLSGAGVELSLSENSVLFGDKKKPPNSLVNIIILWAKHYIWTNKFKNTHLSILSFKFVLFKRIEEFKELCEINEEYKNEFHEWVPIYNYLYAGE